MAIGTNDAIRKFAAALTTISGTTTLISDGAFSTAGSVNDFTAHSDAPFVYLLFEFAYSGTMSAAPTIVVHGRRLNVDGSSDEPVPSSDYRQAELAIVGVDRNVSAGTNQRVGVVVELEHGDTAQAWEFYIENETGASISANWTLKGRAQTIGPKT